MSDLEDDSELLDEIRALEDVLAKDECSTPANVNTDEPASNLPSRRTSAPSRGFGEVTPHREALNVIDNSHTAYETNKMLIELLQESKAELLAILEKCIENKSLVMEKIRVLTSNTKSSKIFIATAGMPYFKDSKHFAAPCNSDAMTKARRGELHVVNLRYTCPWTARDRNILWKAIRQEASAAVLEKERDDGTSDRSDSDDPLSGKTGTLNLPKNFKAMIGPLDDREFDWLKISASDFESRHTSDECRVMWRVFLHPDINRYKWTKDEDSKIATLSKKYRLQDWESLTKELGTQRSAYQCFIRYNTNNRSVSSNERIWTEEEDTRLAACINRFKIGDYVPWGTVTRYMDGRNKNQVYFRWMYNAAPHLRKGRFTAEEDAKLMAAVAKYGRNFSKISEHILPSRSSAQLSDHYLTLVHREQGLKHSWSIDEDAKLLRLYGKHGPDWASIARHFPDRNRTQVRHRHASIIRYWDKGVSLFDIPREYRRVDVNNSDLIDRLEGERLQQIAAIKRSKMQQVDHELAMFFHFAPPASRPGRKAKYYRESELEKVTRDLYVILKTLKAELVVPEELDHRLLTEKDKQLLKSLDYLQLQSDYSKCSTADVDSASARMFGAERIDDNGERHYTPLCSGNCNQKIKSILHDSIDYRRDKESDECQIKLNMESYTPTDVSGVFGEEKNHEFGKLMRIFQTRHNASCERRVVQRTCAPRHEEPLTNLSADVTDILPHGSQGSRRCQARNSTVGKNRRERGARRITLSECSISEGIILERDRLVNCVEPSYYTLLGLQHILSNRMEDKNAPNSQSFESHLPISEKGTRSLEILKKRLVQLFKYPIGLSHILRPDMYAENVRRDTPFDNDANDAEESVEDVVEEIRDTSSTVSKRRRLTAERSKPKNRRGGRSGEG